ncbi:hypothetical protein HRI97_05735 [Treponema socranskii subsp. buccale]|uniref:hypothetical protein n=1 Tax=Treponema socranskii TaxID=53419 RepID=UPI0020A3EA2F|nr:hypothetical protein [Treponema socranskii]UTD02599.1 hypothetical protein HRI97_05735 [Treponema socranskii subsp. buccale]
MAKSSAEKKEPAMRPIDSYGAFLPYLIIPFRLKSAKVLFRFLRTVVRDFFWLQFSVKWRFKTIPVLDVSHPLDELIPFTPDKVRIYLNFTNFWIRPMTLLFRRLGVKKALPYCIEYLSLIETAYANAAKVYRFCMTTTKRPDYKTDAAFKMIHAFDPHLLCVPSLHVAIVILSSVYYADVFKNDDFTEEERKTYTAELREGARRIIESVLYVKQHSVNCIPAAMYMMLYVLKNRFTISTGIDIINSLFADDETLSDSDKKKISAHIHFMFERLLLEGANENDWTVPVKRWLKSYARSKNIVLPLDRR